MNKYSQETVRKIVTISKYYFQVLLNRNIGNHNLEIKILENLNLEFLKLNWPSNHKRPN